MTLPKKDITKSSAIFSAKTMDTTIGEYIGYQFRGEQVKSDKTKILYSTDGSIISMPLEDMSPLLSLEQLEKEMIYGIDDRSRLVRS